MNVIMMGRKVRPTKIKLVVLGDFAIPHKAMVNSGGHHGEA